MKRVEQVKKREILTTLNMLITKQNAEYFKTIETRTVEINKNIIKNRVERMVDNFARLLGAANTRGAAFIRKQAKEFKDFALRNVVARGLAFIYVSYKTAPAHGEELIRLCESMFAQLRAENQQATAPKADFFEIDEQHEQLLARRRTAVARGNKQLARELSPQILQFEQSMPQFLKRAEGKRARRRKSAKRRAMQKV